MAKKRPVGEVTGNAVASQANYMRQMAKLGELIWSMEHVLDLLYDVNIIVNSLTVRIPTADEAQYLVVVRATKEGRAVVGFHGSDSYADTIRGGIERLRNKTMKWREDEYATESENKG